MKRWLALVFFSTLALELFFIGRIVCMAVFDPTSTTFERSQIWQQLQKPQAFRWQQSWMPYSAINNSLKRAVIASEDGDFIHHYGVEWEAVEQAWHKNNRAQARTRPNKMPKIVGGSTITQQLAKNLLLSGERNFFRKGQELILTLTLETVLSKQRILELYLNHVEWGPGIFGAQAAAQHYYRKNASQLQPFEAAKLAVMLPRPQYFAQRPASSYITQRASTIMARMGDAELP